jgi:multidrug efflux pump subunit AcrB
MCDWVTSNPKESIVKINGNNGLVIAIALQEGANLTNLGEQSR